MPFQKGHKVNLEKPSWNKGLTKETSVKLRHIGKSISKAKTGKIFPQFRGENAHGWKGGIRKTGKSGYIREYSPNHPQKDGTGYVMQHRLVMEKHLGRTLLKTEVVHHINGNTGDNRIENLQLFSNNNEHARFHNYNK